MSIIAVVCPTEVNTDLEFFKKKKNEWGQLVALLYIDVYATRYDISVGVQTNITGPVYQYAPKNRGPSIQLKSDPGVPRTPPPAPPVVVALAGHIVKKKIFFIN